MKHNQIKSGILLSYISLGVENLISIIVTPFIIRLLGQSDYGLYNLTISIVAYLSILNFGFGSAYIRYYAQYKAKEDNEKIAKLNGMFFWVFSVLGVIVVVIGLVLLINIGAVLGDNLSNLEIDRAKDLVLILVINTAFSFSNIVFTTYAIANESFVFLKMLQIIKSIIKPMVIIPLLILGYGSIGMAIGSLLTTIIIEIGTIFYCICSLKMKFSLKEFDVPLFLNMAKFTSLIFINMISAELSWNVDKYILGRFHGTTCVAIYGLASLINSYYISIGTTISHIFTPRVHQLINLETTNTEITKLFIRLGRIQFMTVATILSGFIFWGKSFIFFFAGAEYSESFSIALILIIPATIPLIQNIGIEIQRAKNMHAFSTWVYLIVAIFNLIITIPLAKKYLGIGAAFGTGLGLFFGNGIIMNWYYNYRIGLDIKLFWKNIISIIPSFIFPILLGVFLLPLFDLSNIFIFLGSGILYVIITFISLWKLGMNNYEKSLFYSFGTKIHHLILGKK